MRRVFCCLPRFICVRYLFVWTVWNGLVTTAHAQTIFDRTKTVSQRHGHVSLLLIREPTYAAWFGERKWPREREGERE